MRAAGRRLRRDYADLQVDRTPIPAWTSCSVTSRRRLAVVWCPSAGTVFEEIAALAHEQADSLARSLRRDRSEGPAVPYRDEPWYCCAEPNPEQLTLV